MHAKRSLGLLLGASVSASAGAGLLAHHGALDHVLKPSENEERTAPVSPTEETRHDGRICKTTAALTNKGAPCGQRHQSPRLVSKDELGLEQSIARDLACLISSASVYAATQAFYAASAPSTASTTVTVDDQRFGPHRRDRGNHHLVDAQIPDTNAPPSSVHSGLYHGLFGWLRELDPAAPDWNAARVIHSASFNLLLNLVAGLDSVQPAVHTQRLANGPQSSQLSQEEYEMCLAVGRLATHPQCAAAIATRATRYGKQALLHLAHLHDVDPRMGVALGHMVDAARSGVGHSVSSENSFGAANLLSLVSLAVAEELPDEYRQFAFWALRQAVATAPTNRVAAATAVSTHKKIPSPPPLRTIRSWRRTLFGEDSRTRSKRKLVASDRLWQALVDSQSSHYARVHVEAVALMRELLLVNDDEDICAVARRVDGGRRDPRSLSRHTSTALKVLQRHPGVVDALVDWLQADTSELADTALELVEWTATRSPELRRQLLGKGALDVIRGRLVVAVNPRHTAGGEDDCVDAQRIARLLSTVRALAEPVRTRGGAHKYALDRDAVSFRKRRRRVATPVAVDDEESDEDTASEDEEDDVHRVASLDGDFVDPSAFYRSPDTSVETTPNVDGWLALFTTHLRSPHEVVRTQAIDCLAQLVTHCAPHHEDVCLHAWMLAVLDGVLQEVPVAITATSASVRAATTPVVSTARSSTHRRRSTTTLTPSTQQTESTASSPCTRPQEAVTVPPPPPMREELAKSQAAALHAFAFVASRPECQVQFANHGGLSLLRVLLASSVRTATSSSTPGSTVSRPVLDVQREVARVLANLFACEANDLHPEVARFASREWTTEPHGDHSHSHDGVDLLTTVLADWTRSQDVMLQSLAHRARSNRRYQLHQLARRQHHLEREAARHRRRPHANDAVDEDEEEDADVDVSLSAARNQSFEVKYLDGVHPLHFATSPAFADGGHSDTDTDTDTAAYDVDVVFIHGLLGCPIETWVGGPTAQDWTPASPPARSLAMRDHTPETREDEDAATLWAQAWLVDDLKRAGRNPRVLSIGYDSQLLAQDSAWRTMCFQETSQDVLAKLLAARVGCDQRPVVFVTHSLGGVLLKQVLLESTLLGDPEVGLNPDEGGVLAAGRGATGIDIHSVRAQQQQTAVNLVDAVRGVVFYGVPHHGSPIAQAIQVFQPRRLFGIEQHPVTAHLHGTPHLEMLNDWCASVFQERGIAALSVGETKPCRLPVLGIDALVVPPESANPGFGEFVAVADATHVDICKPKARHDERYRLTQQFIMRQVPRPHGLQPGCS